MVSQKFTTLSLEFMEKSMRWADPSWWIWVSVLLFVLCVIHFFPLELKEAENHSFADRILVLTRKTLMLCLLGIGLIGPIILGSLFGALVPGKKQVAFDLYVAWFKEMAKNYWTLPLAAVIGGVLINFCYHRYVEPYLSNLRRKFRVTQAVDQQSDARDEVKKYESRRFEPEAYFKDGFYFVGLDEINNPIYIPAEVFENTNTGKFAPTRYGKGVSAGVILTQAIRRGNAAFMVDPKGDKRLPYILQAEAKRAGKPFVYLDLNPEGKGTWEPFKGGPLRNRRARMLSAFSLEAGGTNADVYKSKERTLVDKLLETTDGTLRVMQAAINKLLDADGLSQLRDGLNEWAQISTFTSNRKKKGHSIETSLLNGAVVYVRGSITDSVVKRATRAYISELMQEAKRLHMERTTHLTTFVDEVRFVISQELVDALATGLEYRTNLVLATQAVSDLKNLEDKTIDAAALKSSFEINCQIKFIYKAGDVDTAEWGEQLSGTKWITVARNQKAETNRWGGELWDKTRAFERIEVPLISQNVFLHLPPMVAVLYRPEALAQVCFTSWMPVDQSNCTWEKKDKDEELDIDDSGGSDLAGQQVDVQAKSSPQIPAMPPASKPQNVAPAQSATKAKAVPRPNPNRVPAAVQSKPAPAAPAVPAAPAEAAGSARVEPVLSDYVTPDDGEDEGQLILTDIRKVF